MTLRRKEFLHTGAAVVAGSTVLAGLPRRGSAAGQPIRLGAIPPITGSNALLGQQGADGVKFAVEEINERPGKVFDDRPFEIVTEDATSDNQTAVAALNKLVTENVDAIVLPVLSTQILAMAPVMKSHEIPWMTGGTNVKNTQQGIAWMFRCRPSDGITAGGMTNFAVKELKAKKVGILHASEAFGVGGADQVEAALKRLGMSAAARESYPVGAKDFTPELLKFKQAGVDALILYIQNPSDAAIILAAIRQQGLNVPLVGSPSITNATALETAGKNAEGAYGALDFNPTNKKTVDFISSFEKKFGRKPDVGTGSGWVYDAVVLLADTMRKIKSTDRTKVAQALHEVKGWQGVMGTFACDQEGNMLHQIGIAQVKNGKPVVVKTIEG